MSVFFNPLRPFMRFFFRLLPFLFVIKVNFFHEWVCYLNDVNAWLLLFHTKLCCILLLTKFVIVVHIWVSFIWNGCSLKPMFIYIRIHYWVEYLFNFILILTFRRYSKFVLSSIMSSNWMVLWCPTNFTILCTTCSYLFVWVLQCIHFGVKFRL